jgi:hypothetical protein
VLIVLFNGFPFCALLKGLGYILFFYPLPEGPGNYLTLYKIETNLFMVMMLVVLLATMVMILFFHGG